MKNKLIDVVEHIYIALMVPVSAIVIYLNWYATHNVGGLHYYEHFARIIKSGFIGEQLPTFPMWGYGWIMLIMQNKLGLICLQLAFALLALYYFVKFLEDEQLFTPSLLRALKIGMIMSVPWYAFHTIRWPYSFAASFFLLSIVLLYKALTYQAKSWFYLFCSALCFGIVLHFRSDYYLMPLGLAFLSVLFFKTKRSCMQLVMWVVVIYASLAPWALYTKKACGHYLLTSTNGGHVAFIGLGHDPCNRWGITVSDGDPVMHTMVNEHFKTVRHSTLDYEADQLLKHTFFSYIIAYPWDYMKKCWYNGFLVVTQGFFPGEFFLDEQGDTPFIKQARIRQVVCEVLKKPSLCFSHPMAVFKIFLTACSYSASVILLLFSYLLLPLTAFIAYKRRLLLMWFIIAAIMYQTCMSALAQNMPSYTSNLYVFFVLNMIYGFSLLGAFFAHYKSIVSTYRSPFKISL